VLTLWAYLRQLSPNGFGAGLGQFLFITRGQAGRLSSCCETEVRARMSDCCADVRSLCCGGGSLLKGLLLSMSVVKKSLLVRTYSQSGPKATKKKNFTTTLYDFNTSN